MARIDDLRKLQQYNFAAYDMILYLDTHPDDKEAFEIFKDLAQKTCQLKLAFEKEYGPLDHMGAARFDKFRWLESPWPWEKEANS